MALLQHTENRRRLRCHAREERWSLRQVARITDFMLEKVRYVNLSRPADALTTPISTPARPPAVP